MGVAWDSRVSQNNVLDLGKRRAQKRKSGGGNGGDYDDRLRKVEIDLARLFERVESMSENMARKKDISDLKVWVLGGTLVAVALSVPIALGAVRLFLMAG